jgi:hypothetical protein
MREDFCTMTFGSADTVGSLWGDWRHALFQRKYPTFSLLWEKITIS